MPAPRRPLRRPWRVAALVVAATVGITAASGGPAPAAEGDVPTTAPRITSGPTGTVSSTTATFVFTHTDTTLTFGCSLDGAAFTDCPATGVTYSGLAAGSHTFRAAARSGGSELGPSVSRTWTIDRTPPTVTAETPAGGLPLDDQAWTEQCGGRGGLCGTSADPAGMSQVRVAIRQTSSGKWWSGSAFTATSATYVLATGTTSWHLPLARPADGAYTAQVRGRDRVGNQHATFGASVTFTIDTRPPAVPVFTAAPDVASGAVEVAFRVPLTPGSAVDDTTAATACSLDGAPFSPCTSPVTFDDLDPAEHCFAVRATNATGRTGSAATTCWWSVVDEGFAVSGDVTTTLYPGADGLVDLVVTNPFPFALRVVDVVTTVAPTTDRPGCDGALNLEVRRPFVGDVVVPARATRSLSELGVDEARWPQVHMPNLDIDQNACRGARFTLRHEARGSRA